jgi:cellulase/cellobiase CelA1
MNPWNTGFTASVTSTAQLSSWALAFTLPAGQTVTSAWNATVSPGSGQVTARNVSYNGTLAPGASTRFGFQATHNGDTSKPAAFTLNGAACT